MKNMHVKDYEYALKTVCVRVEKDCFAKEASLIVSGRDIFMRYMGKEPAFEMRSDRICLYDF